jgi:hypothetical protein
MNRAGGHEYAVPRSCSYPRCKARPREVKVTTFATCIPDSGRDKSRRRPKRQATRLSAVLVAGNRLWWRSAKSSSWTER